MKQIVTIKGKPIIEIYESFNGCYWFITEKCHKQDSIINGKVYKNDQILFGYVRLSSCPEYAEFGYISETELNLLAPKVWKVPEMNWPFCPEVEVREIAEKQGKKDWQGRDKNTRPLASYSNNCKEVDEKMDESTKEKVDDYLEVFNEIKKKTDDSTVAIALLSEICKDRRMQEIKEQKEANNNEPATSKQKRFMDDLGIKYPKTVTKKEASMLIEEEIGKNGE